MQEPPRRTRVRVKRHRRCCERETPTMHTNFSTCGAEGWLAPTGACAAPAWARWAYLEPWVATIAFFVWLALYKTLECGGDIRAAIKAQLEGDEKHVRVAGCVEIKILRRVRAESSRPFPSTPSTRRLLDCVAV